MKAFEVEVAAVKVFFVQDAKDAEDAIRQVKDQHSFTGWDVDGFVSGELTTHEKRLESYNYADELVPEFQLGPSHQNYDPEA